MSQPMIKIAHMLPPEWAHRIAIKSLKLGLFPTKLTPPPLSLQQDILGLTFKNPLGIAAGFDKNAEVPLEIMGAGFGFSEIGTITPRAQYGNPRPRVFRLVEHEALINRLGFNNEGHAAAKQRLQAITSRPGPIGINIGANKDSEDFIADYEQGIAAFSALADYFTINISSPNTPGLRGLQYGDALTELFERLSKARDVAEKEDGKRPPVFLKIAPDLDDDMQGAIASAFTQSGFEGLIISNTTLARETVVGHYFAEQAGGLSGKPLTHQSTIILAKMRQCLGPDPVIIGVGGIHDGQSALDKLEAGANLIQLYSALTYRGFGLADQINHFLADHLRNNSITNIADIIGQKNTFWAGKAL